MNALESDGQGTTLLLLLLAVVILAAWAGWFLLARLTLYETSLAARLEVSETIHPLEAMATARVRQTNLQLGRAVKAGEVLVQLDAEPERRRLEEESSRLTALLPQRNAQEQLVLAEESALLQQRQAAQIDLAEARTRLEEAQAGLQLAEQEAARTEQLEQKGLISAMETERLRTEVTQQRARVRGLQHGLRSIDWKNRTAQTDREVRIAQLRSELTRLEGQITTTRATLHTLEYELEQRLVRSPIDGTIAEAEVLPSGTVVQAGARLGTVAPASTLRIVAYFHPISAFGRLAPGQPARLRLHGFPWGQFGALPARVEQVATEVREGLVRVELAVLPHEFPVTLQHGMPGSLEVEVEQLTPLALTLRAAGKYLSGEPPAAQPAGSAATANEVGP